MKPSWKKILWKFLQSLCASLSMFNPFMLYILFKNLILGFILFIRMSWPHVQNIKDKFLFWFSLQSCCEGPKKFYSFHLHGCIACTKKNRYFSCFLIWSSFSWIHCFSFMAICFPLFSYYFFFGYEETRKLHPKCKKKLSFAWIFIKKF
jgi:hypothetical protein